MSSKKGKLSLKKRGQPTKYAEPAVNTIVSMFKKQEKRQVESKKITSNDCENDDDLFITNVSGLGSEYNL